MKLKRLLAVAALAVSSLANAQVSDSTAIAGVSSSATLDCAANQMKVGSACAVLIYSGAVENAGCTASGLITLGVAASGQLLSCQSGAWKQASGGVAAAAPPPSSCPAGFVEFFYLPSAASGTTYNASENGGAGHYATYLCTTGSWARISPIGQTWSQ